MANGSDAFRPTEKEAAHMATACETGPAGHREDQEMTGEEAIAAYKEWRARVIGDHDTRVHDMLDLLAEMREEPGH